MGLFIRLWVWITPSKVSFITEDNCSTESEGSFLHSLNVEANEMIFGQRNSYKWYTYEKKKGRFWDRIPETDGSGSDLIKKFL